MHAILRSYHRPALPAILHTLDALEALSSLVVVVRADEPRPVAARTVATPLQIRAIEHWGWARALNAGLRALPTDDESVLIVSNEVEVTAPLLDNLAEAAARSASSCGYAAFVGRDEPSYQVPRNTCAIWSRAVFELGEFDERLDDDTGMEDYEMVVRAYCARRLLPRRASLRATIHVRADVDQAAKVAREVRGMRLIEARYPAADIGALQRHLADGT